MPKYYPVFLDVKDRLCVVVGGGEIAERKVAFLLECGARVTLVSPECTPGLQALGENGQIAWEAREYQPGDLQGAFLAIAATDDSRINKVVAWEAKAARVLVNVVDVPHLCTFIAPAIVQRGGVTVAISTGGASPALARKLRVELEKAPALRYADLAEMLSQVRGELRRQRISVDPEHWQACLTQEVLELFQNGHRQEAKEQLQEALRQSSQAAQVTEP